MTHIRYTLLADGSSDAALLSPIDWAIRQAGILLADGQWADLRMLPDPVRSLEERVFAALRNYPCDLLLVHRDAESLSLDMRLAEIEAAMNDLSGTPAQVSVVPVRMTEAWLLHDVAAIRQAAGNPNGTMALPSLPKPGEADRLLDPKLALSDALIEATGHVGRRRKQARARLAVMRHRLADLIDDYSPLRQMPAFAQFEQSMLESLQALAQRD